MPHTNTQTLVNKWTEPDERVNTKWTIRKSPLDPETVIVKGQTTIDIDDKSYSISCSCNTEDKDDSIGAAIQAINEFFLGELQKI